jgi:PAS domain S-box-containing protein
MLGATELGKQLRRGVSMAADKKYEVPVKYTAQEISRRLAYLDIADEDRAILADIAPILLPRSDELVEKLTAHLLRFDEIKKLLADESLMGARKQKYSAYLARLLSGNYDRDYFEGRSRIGLIHQDIGVGIQHYLGAFRLYAQLLTETLLNEQLDPPRLAKAISAISKIIALDMGLALDAYNASSILELRSKADSLKIYEDICRWSQAGIVVTDLGRKVIKVNPAFETLTGLTEKDWLGKDLKLLCCEYVSAGFLDRLWERVLWEGGWRGEMAIKGKSGHCNCEFSIGQVKDKVGKSFACVVIVQDVTVIKELIDIAQIHGRELDKAARELKEANVETIQRLAVVCEVRDKDTGSHIMRVQNYCKLLAEKLGYTPAAAEHIAVSCILHDVGKVHIPDAILMKPGPLTSEEWDTMRLHTFHGVRILGAKSFFCHRQRNSPLAS